MDNNEEKTENNETGYKTTYTKIAALVKETDGEISELQKEVGLIRESVKNGITEAVSFDMNRTIKEQLEGVKKQGDLLEQQQQLLSDLQTQIEENKRLKSDIESTKEEPAGEEK